MKRYLSLALIVLMLPALLAVPAMAAETDLDDDYYLDLCEYTSNNNFITDSTGKKTVIYDNPTGTSYLYCSILFYTSDSNPSISTPAGALNVISIGAGYFRAYGELSFYHDGANTTRFTYSGGSNKTFEVLSFKVFSMGFQNAWTTTNMKVVPGSVSSRNLTYSGNPVDYQYSVSNATGRTDGTVTIKYPYWYYYDYLELELYFFCGNIDSISCTTSTGQVVDYQVSTVTSSRGGCADFFVTLVIDCNSILRKDDVVLNVDISYQEIRESYGANIVRLYSSKGVLEVTAISPEASFLEKIYGRMNSIYNLLPVWFSNQTSAITSSISDLGVNFINSISVWGQNLLDGINALPDKIAEALQSVFVPSDSAVQNMGQQSEELAQDRFGGAYEGALIIDEFASQLRPQQATQILTVPVVNLDILGVPFPLGGWEVDLVPDGTEIVVETCKIIIDIIATLAFINGLRNRLERTLER